MGGLRVPAVKGSRLIVSHTGSAKTGFIPDNLNYLDEVTIIIADNASYHSTVTERIPYTGPCEKGLQEWLRDSCNVRI
jgi:hypothetical protein